MTPKTVQPITDEQLAEIERFLGFGGSMLKTKSDAWRGVIARLRAAENDQARYRFIMDNAESFHLMNIIQVDPDDFESYEAAVDAAMHQG